MVPSSRRAERLAAGFFCQDDGAPRISPPSLPWVVQTVMVPSGRGGSAERVSRITAMAGVPSISLADDTPSLDGS